MTKKYFYLYTSERFGRSVQVFLLGRVAQGFLNIILVGTYVRLLRPDDYGAYMIIWGLVELLVPLSSFGLLETARRFLPEFATNGSNGEVRRFIKWITVARLLMILSWAGIFWYTWPALSRWLGFNLDQSERLVFMPLLLIAVLSMRFLCEMLESLLEQRWSQLIQALQPFGRLSGAALLLLTQSVTLENLLWIDICSSFLCLMFAEFALARRVNSLQLTGNQKVDYRTVITFAWHMAGANILQASASLGALRLLAARTLGLELAGLFAFLQQIVTIFQRYMPAQLLANIVRPLLISRRSSGETLAVRHAIALMVKSNIVLVITALLVFIVVGDTLLSLASGGRYSDSGAAMVLMIIILAATSLSQVIAMALQVFDRTSVLRSQSALFLIVPLGAWIGAQFGLSSMLVGILVAHWIRNVYSLWWFNKHKVTQIIIYKDIMPAIVSSLPPIMIAYVLSFTTGAWFGLISGLTLLMTSWFFAKPLNQADYYLLAKGLKKTTWVLNIFVKKSD